MVDVCASNRDIELSCDENVIKNLNGHEKIEYARLLLSIEANRLAVPIPMSYLVKQPTEERILVIMNNRRKPKLNAIIPAMVVIMIAIFSMSSGYAADGKTIDELNAEAEEIYSRMNESEEALIITKYDILIPHQTQQIDKNKNIQIYGTDKYSDIVYGIFFGSEGDEGAGIITTTNNAGMLLQQACGVISPDNGSTWYRNLYYDEKTNLLHYYSAGDLGNKYSPDDGLNWYDDYVVENDTIICFSNSDNQEYATTNLAVSENGGKTWLYENESKRWLTDEEYLSELGWHADMISYCIKNNEPYNYTTDGEPLYYTKDEAEELLEDIERQREEYIKGNLQVTADKSLMQTKPEYKGYGNSDD